MSKKQSGKSVQTKATEKARREALAVTKANIEKIEAAENGASLHEGTVRRGDGSVVKVSVPRDQPEVTSPALDPAAQQVACIDVDPKAEMAAARKQEARGKGKVGKAKSGPADKPAKQPKGGKGAKAKAARADKPQRLSALDAAAQVLAKASEPMTSQALIDEMAAKGLWKSPGGKTPAATLYAAMTREVAAKGKDARFKKVDRGLFVATGKGA